jgi:hypothetical protein
MTAVSRKVPRHTIDTKWAPLPTNAIDRVGLLLNDVEKSVVMRLQDERRRTQAGTAIQMVSRRLQRKLSRGLPFPQSTRPQREEEFDFEKILDSNRALETRLTPMLHSIDLIKSEIMKEEGLLAQETARLEALESDAKADASRRKKDLKRLHFLLSTDDVKLEESQEIRLADADLGQQPLDVSCSLRPYMNSTDKMQTLDAEEALTIVIDQLHNHLHSMQSNSEQVGGIASAMNRSRAVVQDVLYKHVDAKKYQHVVLG